MAEQCQRVTITISDKADGSVDFKFRFRIPVTDGPAQSEAERWAAAIMRYIRQIDQGDQDAGDGAD